MNTDVPPQNPSEADLEARIRATIQRVFPWLKAGEIRHQVQFSIQLGRSAIKFDGHKGAARGRADIILYRGDTPLAVLELKRESLALTADDEKQGFSYALFLRAPLTIITNGADTRIFATHDRSPLSLGDASAARLDQVIAASMQVATADLTNAIQTLLGPTGEWRQAVRAMTETEIDELTGDWNDPAQRFVRQFLMPRKASAAIVQLLGTADGPKSIIVEGAPLKGKSNVLREIVEMSLDTVSHEVLFVDGASCSEGLFQRMAGLLASKLKWPASADDARNWLRALSEQSGAQLVIALDGPSFKHAAMKRDVEEILSKSFGTNIKLILSLDEASVRHWTHNETGRDLTRLGRFSKRVQVSDLDDDEFSLATMGLWQKGAGFVDGADKATELRAPWLLRAVVAEAFHPETSDAVVLPPMLGRSLIEHARQYFHGLDEARLALRHLASCYLEDLKSGSRSAFMALQSLEGYVLRESAVRKALSRDDINALYSNGFVRLSEDNEGEAIIILRLPELFAAELTAALAKRLSKKLVKDPVQAAEWLANTCGRISMGDVLGAQAIVDATEFHTTGIPLAFIHALLKNAPSKVAVGAGFKGAVLWPELGLVNISITDEGRVLASAAGGLPEDLGVDVSDFGEVTADIDAWLILSQLSGCSLMAVREGGEVLGDILPSILMEVASSPIILRRPSKGIDDLHIHEIPLQGDVACFKNGIVEPITWTLAGLLINSDLDREDWLREAATRNSLPLLNRVHMALTHISHTGNAEWAKSMIESIVDPALKALPLLHSADER